MRELSIRSKRTLRDAMALFAGMLQPEVAALLDRLQAALARPTGSKPRHCCVESVHALRLRRGDFFPAVVELLERGCSQAMLGARLPPRSSLSAALPAGKTLRLLEDDDIDEDGALAAIGARHEHRASLPLLLLGQRFGVLLGSPPLLGPALPVGPHALGAAIAGAARRIGLCVEARMALYRLYDMDFMSRYLGFVEALDASIDRAGILPGLAFVPLRPVDAQAHAGRGQAAAGPGLPEAQARAAKVVSAAVASLRESGRLPESLAAERNLIVAAMARFLLKHGEDSDAWRQALHHARSVIEAVQRGEPPSAQSRAWIAEALQSIGHAEDEAQRVARALTSVRGAPDVVMQRAAGIRSAREQRCTERLANLPLGTRLGYSNARGGFTRCRLRYHYAEPGLLLVANEADGQESLVEIDAIARQMASGHAWIIRSAPTAPAGEPRGTGPGQGSSPAWPGHSGGRNLS